MSESKGEFQDDPIISKSDLCKNIKDEYISDECKTFNHSSLKTKHLFGQSSLAPNIPDENPNVLTQINTRQPFGSIKAQTQYLEELPQTPRGTQRETPRATPNESPDILENPISSSNSLKHQEDHHIFTSADIKRSIGQHHAELMMRGPLYPWSYVDIEKMLKSERKSRIEANSVILDEEVAVRKAPVDVGIDRL